MPLSTLLAEHDLLCNPKFGSRVRMALIRVARDVLNEDPATPGNPLRVGFARTVLTPGDFTSPGNASVIAADPTISTAAAAGAIEGDPDSAQAALTDEQIVTAVSAAWNVLAGYNGAPPYSSEP
ncbi:hypothetical protein [Streptomyces tirandamycinicus]|uniref:Uncharacterized protein n=1 Tax=Streptomyces tirandamycinicus TaxID=2174846 RepID=A0A2S1T207_9ACTN|nr:hypothetical protein [Streptomyces tirandamycinicus]AWI32680.1 hypothetical protein DDW44_30660 [Streptomyces tirandamycinicus]